MHIQRPIIQKNDRFDIEQTFNTQLEATYTLLKNLRFLVSIIVFKLDFPQKKM